MVLSGSMIGEAQHAYLFMVGVAQGLSRQVKLIHH